MLTEAEQIEHLELATSLAGLKAPQIVLPESHHIVIHRMRFHYLDWGTRGRHPIVFLHGGGLNAHTWDVVALMLRGEYHCLALDQRGHGDSEWEPTADYSHDKQVQDIEGFIEKLGLERPLLVGHSMGGFAAIGYAIAHADKLAGLVLVDVGPELSMDGAKRIRDFVSQDRVLDSVDAFVERAMAFNPRRNPTLLRRSLMHNLRRLPNGKWTWKHDPNRMSPDLMKERVERTRQIQRDIHQISCKTLIMRGEHSDIFSDANARKFAESLPAGRWIKIPNAGHTIQGDNPAGLLEALRPFLREIGI
ncbi:MAG TPA: alpha/beta hydrolase [Candidatus Binataceae bacterium]|nr:alpha/beta hydrolase [Candidatus Binataceae bacterium]